jgi:DNA-binding MarR family transcriptional regulator
MSAPLSALDLAALLARRERWLRLEIQSRIGDPGAPQPTRAQLTLLRAAREAGIVRPADLARGLGVTAQTVNQLVAELLDLRAVDLVPDPTDGRAKRLQVSAGGRAVLDAAEHRLAELEQELAERLGSRTLEALAVALRAEWEI